MRDLGVGGTCEAEGINDIGQIVGINERGHAFQLTPADLDKDGIPDTWFRDENEDGINDLMLDLHSVGDDFSSRAYDINGEGDEVEIIYPHEGTPDQSAFIWSAQDGMRAIQESGGSVPYAFAVNDHGKL